MEMNANTRYGVRFFNASCGKIPTWAEYTQIKMGSVLDYFKPQKNHSVCDMLQSSSLHQWSHDGLSWMSVVYSPEQKHLGGSVNQWPRSHDAFNGDK
eukprot:TRINITY_DN101337_c0_g1_i1.p1 TRINITY_DN101337_c0_g1~~TRINITY_DN101337_c0_g1_i1.p1  ORF type:complete len:112 (-),score=19.65 TRINITY_DN101337_c0_g1_i1:122-412(-)